jgi:predicted ATPase
MAENLTNISTSYLAFNDIYGNTKHYNHDRYSSSRKEVTDSLTAHYVNEMIRESDFILNFNIKHYIGESPTDLKISIDMVEENRVLQMPYLYNKENENEIHLNKLWTELNDLENTIWNYGSTELSSYKLPETDKDDSYDYYLIPIDKQKDIFRRLFLINLLKTLLKTGSSFDLGFFNAFIYNTELINDAELGKKLTSINKTLILLIDECDWEETKKKSRKSESSFYSREKTHFELIRNAQLNIGNLKTKKTFKELLNACKHITSNRLFFHYQFSNNYSSGQQNLLNFYSRFYWAKNQLLQSEKNNTLESFRERIIIFIDEGEVALHPEWQRLFFNKVTTFLSELFHDRVIQLILTTHSPFVLSDIPKDNVLFLERDVDGNTKISDIERENTFGSNIYSLLSDSFFMENTIGAFAEAKMKRALDILKTNHNDYSEEEIYELKYIIDSIGEPLIKEQFDHLYYKKFKNDEVSTLRKRIIELEDQIKRGEDDSDKN